MSADAWAPFVAMLVSGQLALSLFRRWWASRRPHLAAWAVSLAYFAIGAGALWYGSAFHWSATTFRIYYLFGAFLNVPFLALGQVRLLAGRQISYAVTLLTVAFCTVGGFIVAFAPLRAAVASDALPSGKELYGVLPRALVGVSNGVGALVVIGGVLLSAWRARGQGPAARSRAGGVLLIAVGVLVAGAGGALTFLGRVSANALGITVGVCIIYAGFVQAGRRVGRHRSG